MVPPPNWVDANSAVQPDGVVIGPVDTAPINALSPVATVAGAFGVALAVAPVVALPDPTNAPVPLYAKAMDYPCITYRVVATVDPPRAV